MRLEDSDILIDLYRGAWSADPWQSLFLRLNDRAHATQSAIFVLPAESDAATGIYSAAQPALSKIPFAADVLQRLRYQRVYASDELSGHPDLPYFRVIRTRADGGGDAWLFLGRRSGDFPATITALISGLGPHLGVAAAAYLQQCRQADAIAVSQAVLDPLRLGWLTLGAAGIILAASTPDILHGLDTVLGQIGGRLTMMGPAGKTMLQTLNAYETRQNLRPVAWRFDDVEILIKPYQGHDRDALATVFVRLSHRLAAKGHETLAEMAHITRSEARFALKLADGLSIAEAAETLGLTLETARNYSKQIYSKMDLRGQTDLIRVLENSVIRLI